jgi:hypothetical protein
VSRNALLCQHLLVTVHAAVSRAMLSRDHLSLALHLARHLLPEQFPDHEWAVLLSCSGAVVGSGSTSTAAAGPGAPGHQAFTTQGGSLPSWLGPEKAAAYEQIAVNLPELVTRARLQDAKIWAPWAASAAGGGVQIGANAVPVAVSSALSPLQQLILVAGLQSERWVGNRLALLPAAVLSLGSALACVYGRCLLVDTGVCPVPMYLKLAWAVPIGHHTLPRMGIAPYTQFSCRHAVQKCRAPLLTTIL